MAGNTARRSGLGSVGVVVEMYKNLTDRAGNSLLYRSDSFASRQIQRRISADLAITALTILYPIVLNHCGFKINYQTFPKYSLSVHLSFQTENIPHSRPGFLPDAPTALKSYDISTSFRSLRLLLNYVPYNIFRLEFLSIPACWSAFPFYYIFYPYFKFYRRTCVVPFTPQTRRRASSSHPLPAISPPSTFSKSLLLPPHPAALHTAPYTQNPSLGTFPIFTISSTFASSYCCRKEDIYALWLYAAHSVLPDEAPSTFFSIPAFG